MTGEQACCGNCLFWFRNPKSLYVDGAHVPPPAACHAEPPRDRQPRDRAIGDDRWPHTEEWNLCRHWKLWDTVRRGGGHGSQPFEEKP